MVEMIEVKKKSVNEKSCKKKKKSEAVTKRSRMNDKKFVVSNGAEFTK